MNLLPTVLGAILICGVLAAGLSSASLFLSLVGFSVSHDILGSGSEGSEQGRGSGNHTERHSHLRAARPMLMVGCP